MAASLASTKQKRPRKPLYLRVERLVRPDTGEEVGALVPMTQWDQRAMRERNLRIGTEVRAELKKRRNVKFHKLAHALGALLVDNVEGFEVLDAHAALKRVQREAGVQCDEMTMELPGIGEVTIKQPRSIAFDEMDESEFSQLFEGVTHYIDQHYAAGLCDAVRDEYHLMVAGNSL
jgi:hypothetical protein